jgi:class 3 adenylate cyclase
VLFADLMGFTEMSAQISPEALVGLLDEVFGAFDALCARHGVEKIKTIGDAYMAAAGLQDGDRGAAARVAAMALEMHERVGRLRRPDGAPLVLRVGVATGPVVAGVLGRRKYSYDLWGDTVNLASRLEGSALPGTVQLCARTREALGGGWAVIARGSVELKGIGEVPGFFLVGPERPPGADRAHAPG